MMIEDIDHIHIEVRDRAAAADWYNRVLGLVQHAELAVWAADPMGPMILGTPSGKSMLSLFARDAKPSTRDATVAFRASGIQFCEFVRSLDTMTLTNRNGETLTAAHVRDHDLSWSLYFVDPDGNRIELTTYDYEFVRDQLRGIE